MRQHIVLGVLVSAVLCAWGCDRAQDRREVRALRDWLPEVRSRDIVPGSPQASMMLRDLSADSPVWQAMDGSERITVGGITYVRKADMLEQGVVLYQQQIDGEPTPVAVFVSWDEPDAKTVLVAVVSPTFTLKSEVAPAGGETIE